MKISVVVPLFNKARHVRGAVMSALAQTLPVHEVIVVDDGSTDGGAESLGSIRDPRLQVVLQQNAGVSAARNRGISLATGDWISFLDADDWQHPRLSVAFAQAHQAYSQAAMLGAGFRRISDDCFPRPEAWPQISQDPPIELIEDLHRRWMQRGPPFFTSSVAIRADLLRAMQPCFACGEQLGEDLDLWFRVAEQAGVVAIAAPLAAYRDVSDGLSKQAVPEELEYLRRMEARIEGGELPDHRRASARWFLGQQQITLAREALRFGRRREALALLIKARGARLSPRWGVSMLMTLMFPKRAMIQWGEHRARRTRGRDGEGMHQANKEPDCRAGGG